MAPSGRRGHDTAGLVVAAVADFVIFVLPVLVRHAVLRTGKPYYDCTADYEELLVKRNAPR